MKRADWTDGDGRKYAVLLPDGSPDSEARFGMPVGPPPLDALVDRGMPHAMMIRLHNELYAREVFTEDDARRRPMDISSALIAALRMDAMDIQAIFAAPAIDDALPPEPPAV